MKQDSTGQLNFTVSHYSVSCTLDSLRTLNVGTDACTVPVLTLEEAGRLDASGLLIPQPHPRVASLEHKPSFSSAVYVLTPGEHTGNILREMGVSESMWRQLLLEGAIEESIIKQKL